MISNGKDLARAARIRELNDAFRSTFDGGRVLVTRGIVDRGRAFHREVIATVRAFARFDADNDPYDEHDFGSLEVLSNKVYFKIDYYDQSLEFGSPDPSDAALTERVLTIMLAEEY